MEDSERMSTSDLVETRPDDTLFAAWCGVCAATQTADRPDEPVRPAQDHVALAGQLLSAGGSRDGTHRALLVGGVVVGALRVIVPTQDNPEVAVLDVAVRPEHRRRGYGTVLLEQGVHLAQRASRGSAHQHLQLRGQRSHGCRERGAGFRAGRSAVDVVAAAVGVRRL